MDFITIHFGKMHLWPVEHFFLRFFLDQKLIWKKTEEKVFNWSEVHLSEVTSYRIHTLESSKDIDEERTSDVTSGKASTSSTERNSRSNNIPKLHTSEDFVLHSRNVAG